MAVTLAELVIADPPAAWEAAGFAVEGDTCRVGSVRIRLAGREAGTGILRWSLTGLPDGTADVDGVPTHAVDDLATAPGAHPNGALLIDHVVLMSPDLARTTAAFEAVGVEARRVRDFSLGGTPMQQVFFRLGEVVLEVIGAPGATGEGPSTFWGLTFTVADLDAAAALLAPHTGRVKDAVQPGRRITTLRHEDLGLSVATALMTPKPPRNV